MIAIYFFFSGLKIFELHKYVTKTFRVKKFPTHFVTS